MCIVEEPCNVHAEGKSRSFSGISNARNRLARILIYFEPVESLHQVLGTKHRFLHWNLLRGEGPGIWSRSCTAILPFHDVEASEPIGGTQLFSPGFCSVEECSREGFVCLYLLGSGSSRLCWLGFGLGWEHTCSLASYWVRGSFVRVYYSSGLRVVDFREFHLAVRFFQD